MAYNTYDRNGSGIVFFGPNASDQTFESSSSFRIDTANSRLIAPNLVLNNNGTIGTSSKTDILTVNDNGTVTLVSGLVVGGDLTVQGSQVILNTEILNVEDNIVVLNANVAGAPTSHAGIEVERGTSANVLLRWDETADAWTFTNDGTNYYRIASNDSLMAGSGLSDGGLTNESRVLNIGQGDGISVSADAIAVNNTVVRTTGTQTISGIKTFNDTMFAKSGLAVGIDTNGDYANGQVFKIAANETVDLVTINNGANFASSYIYLNSITQFNTPTFGSTPLIINPTGYLSTGAVTQGYWRGSAIEVDKGGTGKTSYSNGQLLIGSGTSLAANTLTAGSNIQITNGSGSITIAATGLSLSGHTHTASNITDFSTSVESTVFTSSNFVDGTTIDFTVTAGDSVTAEVKSNSIGATQLTTGVAGVGLSGGNGTALTIDLSEYVTPVAVASGDSFLMLDSDGSTEQRSTVSQLGSYLAGTNVTAGGDGKLSVTDATVEGVVFTSANFVDSSRIDFTVTAGQSVTADLLANSVSETYLTTSVAGNGLTGGNGTALAVGAGNGITVASDTVAVTDGSGVVVNSNGVHVNLVSYTTQSVAANSASSTASRTYPIQINGSDQLVVNVPWTDTGTITGVTAGSGLVGGGSSGSVTLDLNVDNATLEINSDIARVKDSGITTAKIADSNVTTAKIANGAVTEAKLSRTIESVSAATTVTKDITLVTTATSNINITLPAVATGQMVIVKKIDGGSGTVTVLRGGSSTIDGATSKILYYQYESITCVSDGTNWFIV